MAMSCQWLGQLEFSCKELGFLSRVFFLSPYGFVGKAPNKLNHTETHVHPLLFQKFQQRFLGFYCSKQIGPLLGISHPITFHIDEAQENKSPYSQLKEKEEIQCEFLFQLPKFDTKRQIQESNQYDFLFLAFHWNTFIGCWWWKHWKWVAPLTLGVLALVLINFIAPLLWWGNSNILRFDHPFLNI